IAGAAMSSRQIVTHDAKIVFGYVGELWTAGAFAERPHVRRARLQPVIDADEAATVQVNAGLLESDPGGIRNTPSRDQNVAAVDCLFAGGRAHGKAHLLPASPAHLQKFSLQKNLNPFVAENPPHLLRNVDVLPAHELRP